MTIALRSTGGGSTATASATSLPVGWGATEPQNGDLCLLAVETKPYSATINTPSTGGTGWTSIGEAVTGTSVAATTDAGDGKIAYFYHVCDGTHSHAGTSQTISITGGNSSGGGIIVYSKTESTWDVSVWTSGVDTTAGSYSATGGALAVAAGDWISAASYNASDAGTLSAHTMTYSGATLSFSARKNTAVTTGTDSRFTMVDAAVTAGSATSGPVYSYTNTSANRGVTMFVRLREFTPGLTQVTTTRATAWDVESPPPATYSFDFNVPDTVDLSPTFVSIGVNEGQILNGRFAGGPAANQPAIRYVDPCFSEDQFSEAEFVGGVFVGVNLAMPGFADGSLASEGTWYAFRNTTTGIQLVQRELDGTTHTVLDSSGTDFVAGDIIRLEYASGVLTAKINGTQVLTHTPVSPITGQLYVGFGHSSNTNQNVELLDNWSGGALLSTSEVSTTRQTSWNVRTAAGVTRATSWGARSAVTSTRATTWGVRAGVTATRSTTWGTRARVTAARGTVFGVRSRVTLTRAMAWGVRGGVTTSRSTVWGVRGMVAATRGTAWGVLATLAGTRQTPWAVRTGVALTRTTSWGVLGSLVGTRATSWVVHATASTSRATSWSVIGVVVVTRQTSWTVGGIPAITRSTTWAVRSRVTLTRGTSWGVRTRVVLAFRNYAPNPSAEINSNFVGSSSGTLTITRSTEQAWVGSAGWKEVWNTAPGTSNVQARFSSLGGYQAGTTRTFKVRFKPLASNIGPVSTVQVQWRDDAAGQFIPGLLTITPPGGVIPGEWNEFSVTFTVPEGRTVGSIYWRANAFTRNQADVYYWDGFQVTDSPDSPYFDGDSPGGSWTGTPGLSASDRVGLVTSWKVLQSVTATRSTGWGVAGRLVTTRSTTWGTRARPAATRATGWSVRTAAATARGTAWQVLSGVLVVRGTSWALRAAPTTSRSTSWDVLASVTATRATSWDTQYTVPTTPVGTVVGTSWSVRLGAGITRSTVWATASRVIAIRATAWDARRRIIRTRTTSWPVRVPLVTTRSTGWSSREAVVLVSGTFWGVRRRVTATGADTWGVRGSLVGTRATSWGVRGGVQVRVGTFWSTRTTVGATTHTTWAVLGLVLVQRATLWQTMALAGSHPARLEVRLGPGADGTVGGSRNRVRVGASGGARTGLGSSAGVGSGSHVRIGR